MLFIIQLVNKQDLNKMKDGGLDYKVIEHQFMAGSKEEAIEAAKHEFPNHIINENFVLSFKEWRAFAAKRAIAEAEARDKEIEKKAEKVLLELNSANTLGLTVAEYRAMKNRSVVCREYCREIEKLQAQIAEMQSYIDTYEQRP